MDLKELLDFHYKERNTNLELNLSKPDPLYVVKKNLSKIQNKAEMALICALFSYGNAKCIVNTLLKFDFSLLDSKTNSRILESSFPLYRFQSQQDSKLIFLAMHKIIQNGGIKPIFLDSYLKNENVIDGINAMIFALRDTLESTKLTRGLDFLIGRPSTNPKNSSPLKRWNMFLRWLVRKDNIDFGLWEGDVNRANLILPLDTHTFKLSRSLGILNRKSYDLQSAFEITNNLKYFCAFDPIKYDFALYRLGQEKLLLNPYELNLKSPLN